MLSFHGDQRLKDRTVAAMRADINAERLRPGHYWDKTTKTGCFVGCVIRGNEHRKFEDVLGIPRLLARLAEKFFERLPADEDRHKFAVDFLQSAPVGVDLSEIWPKYAYAILVDPELGVIKFASTEKARECIQAVAQLCERTIDGEDVDIKTWRQAREAAGGSYTSEGAATYTAAIVAATAYSNPSAATYNAVCAVSAAAFAAALTGGGAAARVRHIKALAGLLIRVFGETAPERTRGGSFGAVDRVLGHLVPVPCALA